MVEKMKEKKKNEKIFQPAFQGRKETIDVDVDVSPTVGISTPPTDLPTMFRLQCFVTIAALPLLSMTHMTVQIERAD
jgi:hypothetical protein